MRVNPTISLPCILALLTGLLGYACFGGGEGRAQGEVRQPVAIQFSLDRPIDASAAPFVLAASRGLFGSEGLAVTTNIASGSPDAIARVAEGASDFALVDINELIRFRDKPGAPPIKAVFVLFNKSPYAIIARKSRGVHALSDMEGKTLGVAEGDLAIRLWPALARHNGIKIAERKAEQDQRRRARADAVGGSGRCGDRVFVSLRGQSEGSRRSGRRPCGASICRLWLRSLRFRCHRQSGLRGGEARGGERLSACGDRRDRISPSRNPGRAADEVVSRIDGGSRDLELARLRTVISDNILTGEVKRNGIGGIDPARLERSIDQIAEDFKFRKRPSAAEIFDDAFLPSLGGRLIN